MRKAICLLFLLFISACSTNQGGQITSQAPLITGGVVSEFPKEATQDEPIEKIPTITFYNIGDTAQGSGLKVRLNKVTFESKLGTASAPAGKKYAVLDITIGSLSDDTRIISTMLSAGMNDQEGNGYWLDFESLRALENPFEDGELLPGMERTGKLSYLLPENAEGLRFIFEFDEAGSSAVFDIAKKIKHPGLAK